MESFLTFLLSSLSGLSMGLWLPLAEVEGDLEVTKVASEDNIADIPSREAGTPQLMQHLNARHVPPQLSPARRSATSTFPSACPSSPPPTGSRTTRAAPTRRPAAPSTTRRWCCAGCRRRACGLGVPRRVPAPHHSPEVRGGSGARGRPSRRSGRGGAHPGTMQLGAQLVARSLGVGQLRRHLGVHLLGGVPAEAEPPPQRRELRELRRVHL